MWFKWATKPSTGLICMALTPCDAAGSSYIKKQEPKLSLSLGWTGSCGVVTHLVTSLEPLPFNSSLKCLTLLRFCWAAFLLSSRAELRRQSLSHSSAPAATQTSHSSPPATRIMNTEMYQTPMEVAVYQLHNFSISFFSSLLGGDVVSVKLDNR